MSKRIYVGNLPFSATEADIRQLFSQHGSVSSVSLITDRETGRPRGFGFVEMDDAGAQAAIAALDGKEFGGRSLRVNEAQERGSRGGGGGYGGGPRGGGGGYGGGPRGGGGGYGGGPRGGGYGGGGYGGGGREGGGRDAGGRDAGSRDAGSSRDSGFLGDPAMAGGRPDRGRDRGRDRDRDRERRRDHDDEY